MLALAWPWFSTDPSDSKNLAGRLGKSLCAGIGGYAGTAEIAGIACAHRPLRSTAAAGRSWRPAGLPNGSISLFHGFFDNLEEIAAQLACPPADLPMIYGLAVDRWGDDADRKIIGEYCAAIADPAKRLLRLSRSPLRAPPLHYFHREELVAAASVPRALFAAGAPRILNEQRIGDSALVNFSDRQASWFEEVRRVPLGSVVEIERGNERRLRKYYDVLAAPKVEAGTDAEYLARASQLLDEAVRVCLKGFERPGATLSGGLDSPQVAVRALSALEPGQKLPTFTFHPEDGWDGRVQAGMCGDERAAVLALAELHPDLETHFAGNEGYGHDHRWTDFFHLMGGAPSGLCNMYVFHGLMRSAAERGCDVLLLAEWGNYTFSDDGDWGYVEYLLTGRWRQLWRALRDVHNDPRKLLPRFLVRCVLPLMPMPVWRAARRIVSPRKKYLLDLIQPLSPGYRQESGAQKRLQDSRIVIDRYQPRSKRHAKEMLFRNEDAEGAEIYQAFEQMYGVALRDPMSYRPFVEFCFGLPTRMFMRDGTTRWLAKEMAKGIMPDEQRENERNGRWDADWHLRIGRRRADFLREIEDLSRDQRLASMLDLPRMRAALENWPEETEIDPQKYFGPEFAVTRGLLTARFVKWVEGSNQ